MRKTLALCPLTDIKKLPPLFPLPPRHLHHPTTPWMNQSSTQLDRREAECPQMSHLLKSSSNCHRTTLQDIPHTNSDPLDSLNTKLQLIPTHATIPLPLSHLVDQLGSRQKVNKIAASASCRIKLNVKSPNRTDPTHSKNKLELTFRRRLSQLQDKECSSDPLKWSKV